jgi:SAM-dependent methyltransferase
VHAILARVLDSSLAPRFYDYDYLDDIVGIVGGRYCSDEGADHEASGAILDALSIIVFEEETAVWSSLPAKLHNLLGDAHAYRPARGDVTKHVWNVIPDMAEEFIRLKAETNVSRFLAINREYSRRQALEQGLWDNRDLALLRGYERDHHLLLRTLVRLIQEGELSREDEALLIGPRHVDEVAFFRKQLGLPKTTGLDLFKFGKDEILAGDMHDMPFETGRFKLIFCAGTLSYSYNVRKVVEEIGRVLKRPGFVFLIDAAGRKAGPDALGRSDVVGIDTLIGLFYRFPFEVLAKDPGRSLAPQYYENEPCLALKLRNHVDGQIDLPGATNIAKYLR